ncbi:tyrosine-type recombinase/integrase [Lentzea flaviverrucosa]|uniref:Phage integrase family protein n=1 Tax=Lentzea flaviverrucosa TaxID=200379 RepID=A0A1H9XYM8_9PSEU|nr:site-specific integrase [Lentzea flaviverrucosa]RDI16382.1 phage integrase family protein [Lentzea flaviverrucosa]SES51211.1 Phage integrase family protein [Lentzea flaviverrucosa]
MAYIDDRWWQEKKDPVTKEVVRDAKGRPVMEKSSRYGKGDRYRVRWKLPGGKEDNKSFPDKQHKEAKAFKTQIENSLRTRTYVSPKAGDMKVREYAESYKNGRSPDERSRASLDSLFACQVYPFMGDMSLNEVALDGTVIRNWLAWMNNISGIAVNYQYQVWINLSAMLDAAVVDEKIHRNPCKLGTISAPKPVQKLITPWTDEKLQGIHESLPPEHQVVVPIGGGLGLRQGEALAFNREDINRKDMTYHCRLQVTYINGKLKFKLPKGHKTRIVPISHGTLYHIDYHCDLYPSVEVTLPWGENDSKETETAKLILPYRGVTAWRGSMFLNQIWKPTFSIAGIPYIKGDDGMHALRHLYASHMLASNVSIKELSVFLGHSSEGFTLKTYAHLMPSSYGRARLAADTLFAPPA